jgi:carboxylesterase type B
MDEDCLSLAVFAPKGTDKQERLPVVIWSKHLSFASSACSDQMIPPVHGGAFNGGSKQAFSLASMVSSSPVKYIGVSINYRVSFGLKFTDLGAFAHLGHVQLGALGFLPSNLTHRANSLNLGLYDQRYAIEWVQKYISLFGGDPDQVKRINIVMRMTLSVVNRSRCLANPLEQLPLVTTYYMWIILRLSRGLL